MSIAISRRIALMLAIIIIINIGMINAFAENSELEAIAPSEGTLLQGENHKVVQNTDDSYDMIRSVSVVVSSQVIRIQEVDGAYYVFLPAHADFQSLLFQLETVTSNFRISGDKGEAEINDGEVDITALSTADENGAYNVTLTGSNMKQIAIKLMKSANISAMYITSKDAETEGREFVDASKKNSTTGSMCLIDPEGTVVCSDNLK